MIAKQFFSLIAGLIAAGVVVYVMQMLNTMVYPAPDIDPADMEAVKAHIAQLPVGAFLLIILARALGSLVGGFIAGIIYPDKKVTFALIVGAILMSFGLINLVIVPHPVWFWFACMAVYLPAAWAGGKMAGLFD